MFVEARHRYEILALAAVAVLAGGLAAAPAGAAPAGAAPGGNAGAGRSAAAAPAQPCRTPVDLAAGGGMATVDRFDVGNHESGEEIRYDRVVIGLDRPATSYRVRYVPEVVQDGSGKPITLRGNADIEVVVEGASAHDDNGESTIPARRYTRDWLALREARVVSDWEGYLQLGIGVANAVDFTVSTLTGPDRLVIDLAVPGTRPWTCASGAVRVYFFNQQRFVDNVEPFFIPVWRRVATPAVAGGALTSLFRAPLFTESEAGLSLLSSGATGFTGLRISDGIAHVRLTGGCNSGGSTVSIAGSIFPTLLQFSNVQYVKIYDPAGRTGDPTGPSNSVPDCLEP